MTSLDAKPLGDNRVASDRPDEHLVPTDPESWTVPPEVSSGIEEPYMESLKEVAQRWRRLEPFFQSHGYYLYRWRGFLSTVPSEDGPPPSSTDHGYPYGRRPKRLVSNEDFEFAHTQAFRLWAARDKVGREVLIRYGIQLYY